MYLTAESLILVEKWECPHPNLHEWVYPKRMLTARLGEDAV